MLRINRIRARDQLLLHTVPHSKPKDITTWSLKKYTRPRVVFSTVDSNSLVDVSDYVKDNGDNFYNTVMKRCFMEPASYINSKMKISDYKIRSQNDRIFDPKFDHYNKYMNQW